MIATPITPGVLYRVRGLGIDINVLADNASTAITIILETLQ